MNVKNWAFFFLSLILIEISFAGESYTGKDYSNFGVDLFVPIFPKKNSIKIYKNKSDPNPVEVFKDAPVIQLQEIGSPCVKKNKQDDWVQCNNSVSSGWMKRSEFFTPSEVQPVEKWPFRHWMYVASHRNAEDGMLVYQASKHVPYLISPEQFENVFFLVYFDEKGFAISPKTEKKTGDRVFIVGNAVYLAPENGTKRESTKWLFLTYYNTELQALCPSESKESCYSAVNLSPDWGGIKTFYMEPDLKIFQSSEKKKSKKNWYGTGEVAFARHTDPIVPLMYRVPNDVGMASDSNPITDEQRIKNREKPFCLLDCKGAPNPIILNPRPRD